MTTAEATAALIDVTAEELGRMKYNDLRALATRAGINAKGDQETLRKRLGDAHEAASPFKCPFCRRPLRIRKIVRSREPGNDTHDRITRYSEQCPNCAAEAASHSALALKEYTEEPLTGPLPIDPPRCRSCLQHTREELTKLHLKNIRIRTYRDGRRILLADASCRGPRRHAFPLRMPLGPIQDNE